MEKKLFCIATLLLVITVSVLVFFWPGERNVSPVDAITATDSADVVEATHTISPYSIDVSGSEVGVEVTLIAQNDSCYRVALDALITSYGFDVSDTTKWHVYESSSDTLNWIYAYKYFNK